MENGRKAYTDCAKQVLSNEFSAVINTGLISTGIISGLARGSKQLAIAHAVYNHSTTVFPEVWRSYLHGEIVSVGLLLQQYYNNSPEEPLPQVRALGIGRRVGDRAVPQHGRAGMSRRSRTERYSR